MNQEALLSYPPARALPEKSKERALAIFSLRQLWHVIFDPCPELYRLFAQSNREMFEPFLEHAAQQRLSMRWSLHTHLLLWLKERFPSKLSPELSQELLAAAAARWANSDHSDAKGTILHDADMSEAGIAAWKSRSADEDSRVVLVRLPAQSLQGAGVFFATFPDYRYPDVPSWQPIPI